MFAAASATRAIATAIGLCREGHAVVMFPEGTRRQRAAQEHEARWHTGAARIALEAGVPSDTCSDREPTDSRGSARCVFGTALPSRSPISTGWRRPFRADRHRPATGHDCRAGGVARVKPLLVVDGDSFAIAYAIPKSLRRSDGGPGNMLFGFGTMLLRLWRELPRTVLVAWDTLEVPTYRHEALDVYQSGREFEAELLEQLDLLPRSSPRPGSRTEGARLRGGRLPRRRGLAEEGEAGPCSSRPRIATRSSSPTRRTDSAARARRGTGSDRARRSSRAYGVDPEQVRTSSLCAATPPIIPGARGIGPKKAADLLAQYGSLDAMLAEGRFAAEADALRLYRRSRRSTGRRRCLRYPTSGRTGMPRRRRSWA